jgi:CRISPR-associated protein Csb2
VRLIAALTAAAHGRPVATLDAARDVIATLAAAEPPLIVAPRASGHAEADGRTRVARLRGASRWAPRNHELAELRGGKGISPRDPGRSRAEVHKVGVAIGTAPIAFEWPELTLADDARELLEELAADLTVLGTARSPVVVSVDADCSASDPMSVWSPAGWEHADDVVSVRVPTDTTPTDLDRWHERRRAPLRRNGTVAPAPYVAPVALGEDLGYIHGVDAAARPLDSFDPEWWGDMLVVAIDRKRSEDLPKSAAAFALARAMRKALLDTYGSPGSAGEAPEVLRGRGGQPHAAFVPLSFIAQPPNHRESAPARPARRTDPPPLPQRPSGRAFADGRTLGVAVILPHAARLPDVAHQRLEVEVGLSRLLGLAGGDEEDPVRVPGVGPVWLNLPTGSNIPTTLRESRYRRASKRWSTAMPIVHSRYLPRKSEQALYEQVASECADVGLPAPARVAVRRVPRFRGTPASIDPRRLPASWTGPLRGPQAHLDLWFAQPVSGPVLLGRARHFGLGLCMPFDEDPAGEER